ncbi:MAG: Sugar transporter, periplasmic sugar-binding protein, partial [Candidatus Poribacteria bacterium]|nr:Sugar transporter, periplasmic sugar-binding protein [Candidatus Poribacteria bacterium]
MKKYLIALLVFTMLLCAVSGIAQPKKIRIGVLGKSVHPYWDVVRLGMQAAAQ